MKFRVEPKPFAAAVSWVARRVPAKPAAPVLGGILLTLTEGRLRVSGFDYDASATAELDAVGDAAGSLLVSGRLLAELTKTLPDKPVDITTDGTRAQIRCGTAKMGLPLMPVDDYPTLPPLPSVAGEVDCERFTAALDRIAPFADLAGTKGIAELVAVQLHFDADQLRMYGSDRYRVGHDTVDWKAAAGSEPGAPLVPAHILLDLAKTLAGQPGPVTLHLDANLAAFTTADRQVTTRLIAPKQVPNFAAVIPARTDQPSTVDVKGLQDALKRALIVRNDKDHVVLTFTADGLLVHAAGTESSAEADDVVDCRHEGEPFTVRFNPHYLLDGLGALRSATAEFTFTSPTRPVLLTAPGDHTYRHCIVPVRNMTREDAS